MMTSSKWFKKFGRVIFFFFTPPRNVFAPPRENGPDNPGNPGNPGNSGNPDFLHDDVIGMARRP